MSHIDSSPQDYSLEKDIMVFSNGRQSQVYYCGYFYILRGEPLKGKGEGELPRQYRPALDTIPDIRRRNRYFSIAFKVNLSLSDRYNIFSTD